MFVLFWAMWRIIEAMKSNVVNSFFPGDVSSKARTMCLEIKTYIPIH